MKQLQQQEKKPTATMRKDKGARREDEQEKG